MGTPTTEVDLDQVKAAKRWLETARDQVSAAMDQLALAPGKIGNAPANPHDNNHSKPGQQKDPLATTMSVGADKPEGLLSEVGQTHFGFFPSGLDVAHRHAVAYNTTMTNLSGVLKGLRDALAATDYIIANYAKVEGDTLANFQQVLVKPPYAPAPAQHDEHLYSV
jgi:hypothetical protein